MELSDAYAGVENRTRACHGNTVVLKPAETTSLTACYSQKSARNPVCQGVVNIVTGDGDVGDMIVRHKDVHKIAFTGSTTWAENPQATAGSGKSLTLELGGKSPFIVFDDAV